MTADRERATGRGRWRLVFALALIMVAAGALAGVLVSGMQMQQEVDDLEDRLLATESELVGVQSEINNLEVSVDVDGLVENVGAVQGEQQTLAAAVRSLADEMDSVRSETAELSEFLGNDSLFAPPQVDLHVLEGCMSWIVDQISQMANGFAPDYLMPNDCRLLR